MYLPALMLIRRIVGIICVIVGVIGLLMPILPGWPFLIPGIALLAVATHCYATCIWLLFGCSSMPKHGVRHGSGATASTCMRPTNAPALSSNH